MTKRKSKTTELSDEAAMLDGPAPAGGEEPAPWEDRAAADQALPLAEPETAAETPPFHSEEVPASGPDPVQPATTPGPADSPPTNEPLAILTPATTLAALEQRVRRLEDAFAFIQGARPADTAFSARALSTRPPERIFLAPPPATVAPDLSAMGPTPQAAPPQALPLPPKPPRERRPLLLFEALTEVRLILRMIVDPRYRMSWSGRIVPLVLLAAFLLSSWIPGTGLPLLIGPIMNKIIDLVLLFFFFKVLAREAQRYRATSPDLPPALRR